MKTLNLIYVVLFASIFCFMACQGGGESPVKTDAKPKLAVTKKSTPPRDTLSPAEFRNWKTRWANKGAKYVKDSSLTYFIVPKVDIDELYHSHEHGAHFYMGLRDSSSVLTAHIMLVGLDSSGSENTNLILDYSTTCPPYCGGN